MTVTLTYGHGYLTDCDDTTGWTETEDGSTGTLTVDSGDIFNLNVTVAAANKVYYNSYPNEGGATNLTLDSNTYKKATFRYKSDGTVNCKIVLVFNGGTTQTILDETTTSVWTVGTADITEDKTIDHVRFYANGDTGDTYYDFLLLHEGTFTFPFIQGTETFEAIPKEAVIEIPGRIGDITQDLGTKSPTYAISALMNSNAEWALDTIYAGHLLYFLHSDPWQWLTTSDFGNFKVTKPRFRLRKDPESVGKFVYELTFRKKDQSPGQDWTWSDWLGH